MPKRTRPAFWQRLFVILLAVGLALLTDISHAATKNTTSRYEAVVSEDGPICWWRMGRAEGENRVVANYCATADGPHLAAEPVGNVRLDVAGPSGEEFPDFGSDNAAAGLGPGRNYLRVADPGPNSPLDFDNGDELSIEAWIRPESNPRSTYSYIVGKGRTLTGGFGERNQNYSLRLANKGSEGRLSFFFVDAETPDKSSSHNADGHRWTSKLVVPLDGRWHHVALCYKFGEPESIRGYVDGVETGGAWELAGPTRKRPVVDDDDLWIGSSMSGRATFAGAIDEVALYRRALGPEEIDRHVRIFRRDEVQAAASEVADLAPTDRVQYDIFEGVQVGRGWDFVPTERRPLYESDVFALVELPRKYDERAVIVDRENPLMVHAYTRIALPAGVHELAFRSLNGARLYVDGELLAENEFLPNSGGGHGKVYQLEPPQPDRLSLAAAHHETIVRYESDGLPHVFSVLAVAGLSGRPAEWGELVLALKVGDRYELLGPRSDQSPGEAAAYRTYDDAGWLAFLEHDRRARRAWEAGIRREQGAAEAAWWKKRHAAARRLLENASRVELPEVEHTEHVSSPVDRFIQRRLEDENFEPAQTVDDPAFLRRVSLDVVGRIPTPDEIERFLAEPSESRRTAAIERLLADPGWADHWVGYWQHVLAENPGLTKPTLNNSGPFRWYVHEAFLDDKPLDRFVTELVSMQGGATAGGPAGFAKATNNDVPMAHKAHVLGTAFLGVEMKCARCHDAPSHDSKQEDLFGLAAMLARKPLAVPKSSSVPGTPEQLARMAVTVSLKPGVPVEPEWPFDELDFDELEFDGEESREVLTRDAENSRAQLAYRLTHPLNRRFAEVFVNRLWERYLGRGLIVPVHDWEGGEPSHPQLLAYLADELVRSGYSMKHVARLILTSQTYQRGFDAGDADRERQDLFAAATRRRLTAEQLADSLFLAVGKPFDAEELCVNPDGRQAASSFMNLGTPARAWEFACTSNERERPSMTLPRAQSVVDLLMAYGWQQNRQEPINEREVEVTPLAPLVLANGEAASRAIDVSDGGELVRLCLVEQPVEVLVERLMLRLVGRGPTPAERERYVTLLAAGYDERQTGEPPAPARVDRSPLAWSNNLDADANRIGTERLHLATLGDEPTRRLAPAWRERVEDLVWTVVNSPEFVFVP